LRFGGSTKRDSHKLRKNNNGGIEMKIAVSRFDPQWGNEQKANPDPRKSNTHVSGNRKFNWDRAVTYVSRDNGGGASEKEKGKAELKQT